MRLLAEAGPELPLLLDTDTHSLSALEKTGDMIIRMREGRVTRQGGYDGEYGIVHVE